MFSLFPDVLPSYLECAQAVIRLVSKVESALSHRVQTRVPRAKKEDTDTGLTKLWPCCYAITFDVFLFWLPK